MTKTYATMRMQFSTKKEENNLPVATGNTGISK